MNTVYVLPPNENWIIDRFVKEWNEDNADISVNNPKNADVIWLLSDFCWRQISPNFLATKKVITSIHHIVPEKFGHNEREDFQLRNSITDVYHVYNQRTFDYIKSLTTKPIHMIQYWANDKIWRQTAKKTDLREKYGIPQNTFVIGSFQRDTEGAGIQKGIFLPKLEKGPDLLCDYVENIWQTTKNVFVILAGWRRQYVISRLEKSGIPFKYIERPEHDVVNELYQTLDLYPVSARYEGGPQSLIECGLLNVPVVSRPVGIAEQVLSPSAICDDLMNATPEIPNVDSMKLPNGYKPFRDLIQSLR